MFKIVCIPAYNEENTIKNVIERCKKFVDKVIVYDDGSTDQTYEIANKAGAIVLGNKQNFGKGRAMKVLFEYAKEKNVDVMITIDGDGQFIPEEIPILLKPILEKNIDIVIGYRFDDSIEMPVYRKIGNKVLDKFTSLASDLPFRDTQGGFRSYSKNAINSIEVTTDGFGIDSEILISASRKNLKIIEEKISVIYNTGGKTSSKSPIIHSSEVMGSILEKIAINHPLKYLGLPGLIMIMVGIVFGASVLITFNEIRYFSIPYTLISIGTAILGTILLLMAVVLYSISKMSKK